jgi:hypothetical protein
MKQSKPKSNEAKQTRVKRVFEGYPHLNNAYDKVRNLIIAYLQIWNEENPDLDSFKAFDLYITAYLHYCIPQLLNPKPLYSDTKKPQKRLLEIIEPLLKSSNKFTEDEYAKIILDKNNLAVFLARLTASRTHNPTTIPYIIPGSKTTFKNLYDAGYIKPGDKIVLRAHRKETLCAVKSKGEVEIQMNGKSLIFEDPGVAGREGLDYPGFDQWNLAYVIQQDGSRKKLMELRLKFEDEKPFPEHFDSNPDSISQASKNTTKPIPASEKGDEFYEGSIQRIFQEKSERNAAARKACIDHYNAKCFICKFDFGKVYGPIAEGFIHVHHREMLSKSKSQRKTDPIKDLVPLCPNCHSVVHLKSEPLDVEEVQKMLRLHNY